MKSFKYLLRPNRLHDAALWAVLQASRRLDNALLEEYILHYHETGKHLNLSMQDKLYGAKEHPNLPAVVVATTPSACTARSSTSSTGARGVCYGTISRIKRKMLDVGQ